MTNKIISDIIVYSAGGFAFITSIPQLYQIIKTKKVRDLNPYFFILHTISDILYVIYGIIEKDYILSISVSMPATCNFIIFILWIFYNDNDEIINENNLIKNNQEIIHDEIIHDEIIHDEIKCDEIKRDEIFIENNENQISNEDKTINL